MSSQLTGTKKHDDLTKRTNEPNMADSRNKSSGSRPPPAVTYKNPRRTSPENSITLRHHRLARESSKRPSPAPEASSLAAQSPRRNSSDESNETGVSDPQRWFDRSNENPNTVLDTTSMDVDPPFFQKESDSYNEEGNKPIPSQSPVYKYAQSMNPGLRPGITYSSSADDYRSVIDDLTIENKRLREELKRCQQMGPDSLRREKLFEVKVHGLPRRKKRELENALRDFTTSLDGSSTGASPGGSQKDKGKSKGVMSAMSKHASSSSGSQSRPGPTDSAYASMSTGPSSSVPSLPGRLNKQKTDRTVERYLQDVPEGLWPKSSLMTEKERKKLVVRRLEQLFTGKAGQPQQPVQPAQPPVPPISEDVEMAVTEDKSAAVSEAIREAQIRPRSRRNESHSRDNGSASNSNGDQTDSRDNGNGSGSGSGIGNGNGGNGTSPHAAAPPEQRPTRPRDLDPDRIQVPAENMEYIRHLGLVAPQKQWNYSAEDVSPDAEGWVYLNLLCNLAQLHILNVTPAFIRAAVTEKSKQFQLSPDGRKIRWRGGAEGTKFSSDSSGSNSQRENSGEDSDASNEQGQGGQQRKKQKTGSGKGNDVIVSEPSQFRPQLSGSSESWHYKPLFVQQQTSSSDEQPSQGDETGSSFGPPEESNLGMNSRWNHSGVSGVSQRKRRRDGAIIYYSGAPFCTDLSGDWGGISPELSNEDESAPPVGLNTTGPRCQRTSSGSSIRFKPLSSLVSHRAMMDLDFAPPEMTPDESEGSNDMDADFPWSNSTQPTSLAEFEASGLAGVSPDDHFVVHVSTRRPKTVNEPGSNLRRPELPERRSQKTTVSRETTDSIVVRLATMSTGSPAGPQFATKPKRKIEIEYVSGRIKHLPPTPLPPPTYFFGRDEESDSDSAYTSDDQEATGRRFLPRPPVATGALSVNEDLSSADEEDENSENEADFDESESTSPDVRMGEAADPVADIGLRRPRRGQVSDLSKITGSSAATAGGAPSAYNSSLGDI